jgi:chromosome transmission fidelity protein 4
VRFILPPSRLLAVLTALSSRHCCRHSRVVAENRDLHCKGWPLKRALIFSLHPIATKLTLSSSQRISALAFSVNGLYLASAAEGEILVWSVKDRTVVSRFVLVFLFFSFLLTFSRHRTPQTHGLVTGLAFHPAPTANSLAYIDNKGQLTRWQNPVPTNLPSPTFARPAVSAAASKPKESKAPAGRKRSDSGSTSTSSHAGGRGNLFRQEAEEDDYGDLDDLDLDGIDGLDGWIDDDLGDGGGAAEEGEADLFANDVPLPGESRRNGREDSIFADVRPKKSAYGGGEKGGYSSTSLVPKGQPPFQPGATPWREKRRYLGAFSLLSFRTPFVTYSTFLQPST